MASVVDLKKRLWCGETVSSPYSFLLYVLLLAILAIFTFFNSSLVNGHNHTLRLCMQKINMQWISYQACIA